MSNHYIEVLEKTERVDGQLWRLLPKAVETDNDGRHWIPETKVVIVAMLTLAEDDD